MSTRTKIPPTRRPQTNGPLIPIRATVPFPASSSHHVFRRRQHRRPSPSQTPSQNRAPLLTRQSCRCRCIIITARCSRTTVYPAARYNTKNGCGTRAMMNGCNGAQTSTRLRQPRWARMAESRARLLLRSSHRPLFGAVRARRPRPYFRNPNTRRPGARRRR
jgi:hypothetical protein